MTASYTATGGFSSNAGAGVSIGATGSVNVTEYYGAQASLSATTQGVAASASAGMMMTATVTVTAGLTANNGGNLSVTASASVLEGSTAGGSIEADNHGVGASANVFSGVGTAANATVAGGAMGSGGSVGAGVMAGDIVGIGGGASATVHGDTLTLSVVGDVALLLGIKLDLTMSINFHPLIKDFTSYIIPGVITGAKDFVSWANSSGLTDAVKTTGATLTNIGNSIVSDTRAGISTIKSDANQFGAAMKGLFS